MFTYLEIKIEKLFIRKNRRKKIRANLLNLLFYSLIFKPDVWLTLLDIEYVYLK